MKTIINPHVICRETEAEAQAQRRAILEHQDPVAADRFYATFAGGDQTSWRAATREDWVIGGNVHVVGSPEQVVEAFAAAPRRRVRRRAGELLRLSARSGVLRRARATADEAGGDSASPDLAPTQALNP